MVNLEIGGELKKVKGTEKISPFLLPPLLFGSSARVGVPGERGGILPKAILYVC